MITIEKAIEVLTSVAKGLADTNATAEFDATKLGIKALERFRNLRAANHYIGMPLLKGEKQEVKNGT